MDGVLRLCAFRLLHYFSTIQCIKTFFFLAFQKYYFIYIFLLGNNLSVISVVFFVKQIFGIVFHVCDNDPALLVCRTTLHWAALGSAVEAWPSLVGARYGSNMESAQLLLKAGAEVKSRDDAGCTPMHYAAGKHSALQSLQLEPHGSPALCSA